MNGFLDSGRSDYFIAGCALAGSIVNAMRGDYLVSGVMIVIAIFSIALAHRNARRLGDHLATVEEKLAFYERSTTITGNRISGRTDSGVAR